MKTKAVCLLSGGLDSATTLYMACEQYEVYALTVNYGQLHSKEIECAKKITEERGVTHKLISVTLPWKGSALLDRSIPIPVSGSDLTVPGNIPVTYVPARNTILLALAASWAETIGAQKIFIGANVQDYSGYPDCRPEYFQAFSEMLRLGTKAGVEGKVIGIEAPLIALSKKEIVELGQKLGVPFEKTWSCYQGQGQPCGVCDSCRYRAKGFKEAGLRDPLMDHAIPTH